MHDNSNSDYSNSKKRLKGQNFKSSLYLKKIKNTHAGHTNIYESFFSLWKILYIFLDMAKKSFTVYLFLYFFKYFEKYLKFYKKKSCLVENNNTYIRILCF